MLREIERDQWRTFLDEFSGRNRLRDAHLQTSGQVGSPRVERGLLLESVILKLEGDGAPRAEFSFGGSRPQTRSIPFVRLVAHQPTAGGRDEVLEILSDGGVRAFTRGRVPRPPFSALRIKCASTACVASRCAITPSRKGSSATSPSACAPASPSRRSRPPPPALSPF